MSDALLLHGQPGTATGAQAIETPERVSVAAGIDASTNLNTACAVLQLSATVSAAPDQKTALVHLVNALQQHFGCDAVAVGLLDRDRKCRLKAISGLATFNAQCGLARALQCALNETLTQDRWTHLTDQTSSSLPGHRALSELLEGSEICSSPLYGADGVQIGAWIGWDRGHSFDMTPVKSFAAVAATPIGSVLQLMARNGRSSILTLLSKMPLLHRRSLWAALAAIVLLMFILRPYRIACDCAIEAAHRRFVAAPYAGLFEKSLVRPGDLVQRDQTLAVMDGRELRIELDGLQSDYERAKKSRDVNLAGGKTAGAQIDRMEMERVQLKQQLVENRLRNLEIKSPVSGIVMAGDLDRSEGAPVTIGQTLYEIAALDNIIVEIAIRDGDVSHAELGQGVELSFEAFPGERWSGIVRKIHPRSETRDSRNVFIAEVAIDGETSSLRPGMKGRANLVAASHTLGWIMFHKLWHSMIAVTGL